MGKWLKLSLAVKWWGWPPPGAGQETCVVTVSKSRVLSGDDAEQLIVVRLVRY